MATKKKTGNKAVQKKTRMRRRAVEKLYLQGMKAAEIHDHLVDEYGVIDVTIRKDIVEVRKAWKADVDEAEEFEGRHRYLASLREVRERALAGWEEMGKFGEVIKGRDLTLAHTIDKEIARLSGVNLKIDDRNINLNLKAAVAHMEDILKAIFSVIQDQDQQDRVIEAIDAIAEE